MRTADELEKRRVYATYYNQIVRERLKLRNAINATAGLPWRDCDSHRRGGAFKTVAPVVETRSRKTVDGITGDVTIYRGTGFYVGRINHG